MRLCDWSSDVCSSDLGSAGEIVNLLLQNAWGEYLAVLADSDDSSAIALFRDPSGAMPCVYSLLDGEGFITSDIGLAVDLGLYRREVNWQRSEEHTSELQSLMRISYAVFCLKKKNNKQQDNSNIPTNIIRERSDTHKRC